MSPSLKQLWRSPTLWSTAVYAAGGLGFAGANLILARFFSIEQYALFTLLVALGTLGYTIAPAGLDGLVNRHGLAAGPPLLARTAAAACLVGLVVGGIAVAAYDLSLAFASLVFGSTAAGGAMVVAAAKFQSEQRFGASLALQQSPNIVLLLAAIAAISLRASEAWLPVLISGVGFVVAAVCGWLVLLGESDRTPAQRMQVNWREAFAFAGLGASMMILIQLERLVIPQVLPLSDLALYGVLAAIAGSIFRIVQMGVGFSLLPRLRAAPTVAERRRLIGHELRLAGAIVVLGAMAVLLLTPLVERWVLDDKYDLSSALLIAAIVSGIAKVSHAFVRAAAAALASPRELSLANVIGWISVGVGIAAAVGGARWGLTGVLYGVALGWFLRTVVTLILVVRHLRMPAAAAATAREA